MIWLPRLGALLLTLFVTAVAVAVIWWQRVMPVSDGRLEVAGLAGEVSIERDANGIPTLRAASRDAALFGLGFVHAQDRLWQLETHRRIGAGRLSEAFGPGALDNDKFLRALGVRRAAAAQWAALGTDARGAVLAYTAGINAFLADHLRARPPEFLILGLQPEPWTPEDTLAWGIMMAWDLGGNWSNELLRMRLALSLPVARIDQLLPPYPGEKPLPARDYAALYRELKISGELGQRALLDAPESGVEGVGSNNWVLAGSRTASGKPLLANDPHLKLTTPALWYFARLEFPGQKLAGATMPGLPLLVMGQNERIAWGLTNTNPDVQDVYLEQIKADDPARYRTPDGWAEFQTFSETIRVKGQADVILQARATRHGPVISDAGTAVVGGLTGKPGGPAYALALRWTALDANAASIDAGLAISAAGSVAEFIRAAEKYVAPMQNMVVADVAGSIGFIAAGRVPLRPAANDLHGLAPLHRFPLHAWAQGSAKDTLNDALRQIKKFYRCGDLKTLNEVGEPRLAEASDLVALGAARLKSSRQIADAETLPAIGAALRGIREAPLAANFLAAAGTERHGGKALSALNTALFGLLVLVAIAWGVSFPVKDELRLRQLQTENQKIEPSIEALRREESQLQQLRKEAAFMTGFEQRRGEVLRILDELSKIVPSNAYFSNLRYRAGVLEIQGSAENASTLIPLLERSALFENVAFNAPSNRGRDNRETFSLKADLEKLKEAAKESAKDTSKEVRKEPTKEPVKEPVKETKSKS